MDQFWYLIDDSRDLTGVRIQQADADMLKGLQALAAGRTPKMTDLEKERFLSLSRQISQSRVLYVSGMSISPDGYYALLNAALGDEAAFFLLSLETMEILPVSAPEGLASNAIGTIFGQSFATGMTWFDNGALLIYNASSRGVEAYRLNVR